MGISIQKSSWPTNILCLSQVFGLVFNYRYIISVPLDLKIDHKILSPIIPTFIPTQLDRVEFKCKVYAEGSNKRFS